MFYFRPEDKEEEPSWVSISDIASIEFGASIIIRDSNRAAPQKEEKPQDKENEKTGVAPFSFPKK